MYVRFTIVLLVWSLSTWLVSCDSQENEFKNTQTHEFLVDSNVVFQQSIRLIQKIKKEGIKDQLNIIDIFDDKDTTKLVFKFLINKRDIINYNFVGFLLINQEIFFVSNKSTTSRQINCNFNYKKLLNIKVSQLVDFKDDTQDLIYDYFMYFPVVSVIDVKDTTWLDSTYSTPKPMNEIIQFGQ